MPTEPTKAYATIRFAGDLLIPDQITRLLRIVPTLAYAKGEPYRRSPSAPPVTGRTGVWYFCTDGIVAGNRLPDHLVFLLRQVIPDPAAAASLQALMRRKSLQAVVTAFWHGPVGARPPSIPRQVSDRLRQLPATIETDFDTDDEADRHAA